MKIFRIFKDLILKIQEFDKRVYLIYALLGILAGIPFVYQGTFLVSWIIYVPLFVTLFSKTAKKKRVFGSLFCFFEGFYLVAYHWFLFMYPLGFAGLSNVQSAFAIGLIMIFVPGLHALLMSLVLFSGRLLTHGRNSFDNVIIFPTMYTIGEFLQTLGIFAFPWARLFVPQMVVLQNVQMARIFGSFGVTFLIILFNALVGFAVMSSKRKKAKISILFALLIVFVNFGFGNFVLNINDENSEKVKVCALQGNMSSDVKWEKDSLEKAYEIYETLANSAKDEAGDLYLLVMPETNFPTTLIKNGEISNYNALASVYNISQNADFTVAGAFLKDSGNTYNSLYVLEKDTGIVSVYSKQKLVPMGEFVPFSETFEKLFPFVNLNLSGNDISAGEKEQIVETNLDKFSCLVCFDSVFPDICRQQVKNGARICVVSTNDSWYKTSSALWHHANHARMRAIENNVPVVRSANTGISMLVSPTGKVVKSLGVNKFGYITASLDVPEGTTFYTQHGDMIVYFCFAYILLMIIVNLIIVKIKKDS